MQIKQYSLHLLGQLFLACLIISDSHITYTDVVDDLVEIERVELHCPIILYASDFGPTGTIIDQPGYYILCGDVAWTAADSSSAITTATNHVTIDLNNLAIYQTNKGAVSNVNGITINQNIHDVTIKNGTLSNFTTYGITGIGDNQNVTIENVLIENIDGGIIFNPAVASSGCIGLTISNCMVNVSTSEGLVLLSCSDVTIHDCSFIQAGYGAYLDLDLKCRFIDCHFDNNSIKGAYVRNSQEILFDNCTFNKNLDIGLQLDQVEDPLNCEGIIVQNCQAIGNTSAERYAVGFYTKGVSGVIFKNCIANSNESSVNFNYGAGFWLYETQKCRLEQCVAENNKGIGQDGEAYGIRIEYYSQDNLIINCKTNNNNSTATASGYGIKVYLTIDNTTMQNCEAFSNSGYGIYNDSSTSLIKGCISGNNGTASFGGTYGAHYAKRNKLGNHFEIGEQENISIETNGINEVGCVTYLGAVAFGTTGIVINQPGHYILCEDINFSSGFVTAFSIESDFVTLDLNDKSISGTGLDTVILITPEKHDIVIKNGTIADFGNSGVFVASNCHHIDIENMNMSQAACTAAIEFNGISGNEVHDCRLINCSITEINTLLGKVCYFNYCNDIQFIDCAINKNTSVGALEVVSLDHSNKCQFINCQFNDNEISNNLTVVLTINSDSLLFDNCTFNNNTATDNLEIIKGGTSGSIVRNCLFLNNSGAYSITDHFFCIDFDTTATGNIIDSCRINGNGAAYNQVGIYLGGYANKVKQTKIQANYSYADCRGIRVARDYNIIDGCWLLSNLTESGDATGILIEATADKTVVKNCLLFANSTNGINNNGTDSVIIGCAAGNNGTDYAGTLLSVAFKKLGDTSPQPVYEYDNVKFTV